MAGSRRAEWLRTRRSELHEEAPDGGAHRNNDFRRYAGRLVGSLRVGSLDRNGVRMARQRVLSRSAERPRAYRFLVPAADYLEQGPHRSHQDTLLVWARTLLVRAKEECTLVRQGRRKFHHLGVAVTEVHH